MSMIMLEYSFGIQFARMFLDCLGGIAWHNNTSISLIIIIIIIIITIIIIIIIIITSPIFDIYRLLFRLKL